MSSPGAVSFKRCSTSSNSDSVNSWSMDSASYVAVVMVRTRSGAIFVSVFW